MIENVTTALQVNATTGNGQTLALPEPRLVTVKITGHGPVSAGQITIECCPQTLCWLCGQRNKEAGAACPREF